MSRLSQWLQRLARPPEDVRAENLRRWRHEMGIGSIADVEPRERTRAAGVIENIRIDPRAGHGSIEAEIFDGSGTIVARWLGRSSLSGIRLGTGLVIEGVPGRGDDGELVILNPDYELLPAPEHG